MQDGPFRRDRRRTDGDGNDAERAMHRRIAQAAYELFVDTGRDPRLQLECWRQAEESILHSSETPPPGSREAYRPDEARTECLNPPSIHSGAMLFLRDRMIFGAPTAHIYTDLRACQLLALHTAETSTGASRRHMVDAAYTWLFVRGQDALTIERLTKVCLAVSSATGDRQVHDFDSAVTLLEFQFLLHRHLIETGWMLEDFYPERRMRSDDRRHTRAGVADRRVLCWPPSGTRS
jgi:hypothetical protein